jgi:hypothetical protein
MIIICKERGKGKTFDLVKLSSELGLPILYRADAERSKLIEAAVALGVKIVAPVKVGKIYYGGGIKPEKALIDDFDTFSEYHEWNFPESVFYDGIEIVALTVGIRHKFTKEDLAKKIGLYTQDFVIVGDDD